MTKTVSQRLLCLLLAMVCLCTGIMVHDHECLDHSANMHAHNCAVDCCITCSVRSLITCAILFICGRIVARCIAQSKFERHGAPPEESEGTLVQLKVKLSN